MQALEYHGTLSSLHDMLLHSWAHSSHGYLHGTCARQESGNITLWLRIAWEVPVRQEVYTGSRLHSGIRCETTSFSISTSSLASRTLFLMLLARWGNSARELLRDWSWLTELQFLAVKRGLPWLQWWCLETGSQPPSWVVWLTCSKRVF